MFGGATDIANVELDLAVDECHSWKTLTGCSAMKGEGAIEFCVEESDSEWSERKKFGEGFQNWLRGKETIQVQLQCMI